MVKIKTIDVLLRKIGTRPKSRSSKAWKKDRSGVIYVPTKYVGKKVRLEITNSK